MYFTEKSEKDERPQPSTGLISKDHVGTRTFSTPSTVRYEVQYLQYIIICPPISFSPSIDALHASSQPIISVVLETFSVFFLRKAYYFSSSAITYFYKSIKTKINKSVSSCALEFHVRTVVRLLGLVVGCMLPVLYEV